MKCTIKCPHCGQQYEDIEYVPGQKVECESCQQSFVICMSVVVDTPTKPSLFNGKQSESETHQQNSDASPVENWMENKLGNGKKSEVGNHIKEFFSENFDENWLVNWQKNIKPKQIKENDLAYLKTINNAITIWTWWTTIVKILLVCSLPISIIAICVMLENDNCSNDFCRLWIPIIIFIDVQLLLAWLFSLFSQTILESFRALNNNTKVIAIAITNLKENMNIKSRN